MKSSAINILEQNFPNPFNPYTTIEFQLAQAGSVTLEIFGPNGQHITTLVNGFRTAGNHSVSWNASSYSSGIYVCRITAGEFTQSRKMTFMK